MKPLKSFRVLADERSRILILGSMPGPEALRLRQYYGFSGNHFWRIIKDLFLEPNALREKLTYHQKLNILKENRIAVWDVAASCLRLGASDSSICRVKPNNIPRLLKKYSRIRTIFLNGRAAEKFYRTYFGDKIQIPAYYLPSTSPAHAAISYEKKLEKWTLIKKYLVNRNDWC